MLEMRFSWAPRSASVPGEHGRQGALAANRLALLATFAVAASFALVLIPTRGKEPLFLTLAGVVGGIVIGGAFLSRRFSRPMQLAVPLGYLLMVALLREAEGGATSGFGGLFLIAITFLALSGNRFELVLGLAALLLAQLLPILVWGAPSYPSSGYRGVVVFTTAATIIGLTIQQLLADLSEGVERDVLRRVVEAQEVERRRLARELHDEAGQNLTSMLIGLKALEESSGPGARDVVASLRDSVVETLRGLRRIVVELRPKALDDLGLVSALEALASNFADQTGVKVEFIAGSVPRLQAEAESALYRIVQEGLTNVMRHAAARRVSVSIGRVDHSVRVAVEDDGRGFDGARTRNNGFGLTGIGERVQLLGGRFAVTSREGRGTSLVVEVPLP
jgi:signal transduction histidine kinase